MFCLTCNTRWSNPPYGLLSLPPHSERVEGAYLREQTDRIGDEMRSGRQAGLVGSCSHISIPTAITPTVASAIQVSSLLFSATQSAIDECATL